MQNGRVVSSRGWSPTEATIELERAIGSTYFRTLCNLIRYLQQSGVCLMKGEDA